MSERNEEMTAFLLSQQIASDPELRAEWNRKKAQEVKNGAIGCTVFGLFLIFGMGGDLAPLGMLAIVAGCGLYLLNGIKTFFSR